MADVTIDGSVSTSIARGLRAQVWVTSSIGYQFYIDSGGQFVYSKTTNGGAAWGAAVTISAATTNLAFDVWFDQWTPGDTGTRIHTVYFDSTVDDVIHRSIDVLGSPTDAMGPETVIEAESTAVAAIGNHVSITKTDGGNLYVSWDVDAGAELGFERSTDGGGTWAARTIAVEAAADWSLLLPAQNTGDLNDCFAVYLDASTNELTVKWYDDTANTWTESSVIATVVENTTDLTGQYPFSASIRHSDGKLIIAVVTERDTAASDHRVFEVDHNGTTFTITELASITTNIDDHYYPQVFIDQESNDIYVAYTGLRDGSETLGTTTKVYYVKSTDDGASWSAGNTAYMEGAAAAVLQLWTAPMGLRFYVSWRQASTTLIGNAVNSVAITEFLVATLDQTLGVLTLSGVADLEVLATLNQTAGVLGIDSQLQLATEIPRIVMAPYRSAGW